MTMNFSPIGVLLLFLVLFCDAADIFWCKFTENGEQTYGFYCGGTAVSDAKSHQKEDQPQHPNNTNCLQFSRIQPNLTLVTQLKFHKCDFDFVIQQCKSAEYLNVIDISYSDYQHLNFADFAFHHLEVVNASNNNLQRIDANTFANATQLLRIDLSRNNLTSIDTAAFTTLIHLEWIDLSKNQIQTLESLQNNRKLRTIRAMENPISSFDCNNFAKMNNVSVFISWNRIKKFELTCKKPTTQFRVISNATNELVALHNNAITSSVSEIYCSAGSMTQIDSCAIAGRNRLENITQFLQCLGTKIKRLTLSGTNARNSLDSATFQRFVVLEWLNLKDTSLSEFDIHALQRQMNTLTQLDISQNRLTELKSASLLGSFNSLREFKASGNQIQNTQGIIANLRESIKWLDLADSFVGEINATTFQRFENLTTLKLSNTSLTFSGNRNPFHAIKNLNILDLSENDLSALDFSILASTLSQLTRFYAVNCHLTNATNVIQYLGEQQLLELDLSSNNFTDETVTVHTFKRLKKLQYLHLNGVNLRTFDFNWLKYNQELRVVKLSNNELHSIHIETVMVNLKRLDLDGNDLINLNDMKRSILPQLDYLAISRNNFECNELMELQKNLAGVKFIGEPLQQQKHGRNCCLNLDIQPVMNDRSKYAIIIAITIVIVSLAMIMMTYLFFCRKPKLTRSEKILKKIRQSMRDSEYFVPNFQIPDDNDGPYDMDGCFNENNDVYETISLGKHEYDHLQFDTDPKPFNDDDDDENYLHIGLMNAQIPSRNLTSRL